MAKEFFEEWNPKPESLERVGQVNAILDDYKKMRITLTLRQLYYQLVSKNLIGNKVSEYSKLSDIVSRGRRSGMIDWDAIEDRLRKPNRASEWTNIQDIVDTALAAFRLPRWEDQPEYVELWCEKDALTSVLEPITRQYHVTLMVCRGYCSDSAMKESADRIKAELSNGRDCHILYLGDFDPSGEDMVRDIRDRMELFGARNSGDFSDDNGNEVDLSVKKIALTLEQIAQFKPPPNPAKVTDPRAGKYIEKYGRVSWEVDAIPPDELQEIVSDEITSIMDLDLYEAWKSKEDDHKAKLRKVAKGIK